MFMEQVHNKQVASVDFFPTQCISSIGSNGVIRESFTVCNDSLMRVMLFIQHTVTGGLWVGQQDFSSQSVAHCIQRILFLKTLLTKMT